MEAKEHMTLWNSNIEASPFLPIIREVFDGIGHTPQRERQHRYGDDPDENSSHLDHSSLNSKGHESDPVDGETNEGYTYYELWKKQMESHDGGLASADMINPESIDVSRSMVSPEDMPIRPGIGPGSYARTFEELLQNTLKNQENNNSDSASISHSQVKFAKDERLLMPLEKMQDDRHATNDGNMDEVTIQEGTNSGSFLDNGEGIQLDRNLAQKEGIVTISNGSECGRARSKALHNATDCVIGSCANVALFRGNADDAFGCALPFVQHPEGFDKELITYLLSGFTKSSKVVDLSEVEMEKGNLVDDSYPISSCTESVSEEEISLENEPKFFYSLDHLEDSLFSEENILEKENPKEINQNPPLCAEDIRTEDSSNATVKFEDILALLKLRARKGCHDQTPPPILEVGEVCERAAMDDILGCEKVDTHNESNSCLQFQVHELVKHQISKSRNGKREVQLPYVHIGTNVGDYEVCAQSDLEHINLSASVDVDRNVQCLSDINVNELCLDIDSCAHSTTTLEKVLCNDESNHSAVRASDHEDHAHMTHWWHHYHDMYDVDIDDRHQQSIMLGRDREIREECCSGASEEAMDQPEYDTLTDQRCQVEVLEDGHILDNIMGTKLPLRACLVPLQDLVNRPQQRIGNRHVGPDKHKAILLYKNPLWTDESGQDLTLLMSNCQLQDDSKSMPKAYTGSELHPEMQCQKVDRRKGWNVDASVSMQALRMASLSQPNDELEETQEILFGEHDGRPLRKKCKGTLYDETCHSGIETLSGKWRRQMASIDASWLSEKSLSDEYATEIIVGNGTEGGLEDKVVHCNACNLNYGVQSTLVGTYQSSCEVAESGCPCEGDEVMARESSNGSKQLTATVEKKQGSLSRASMAIHRTNNEHVGETEKLLAALELEEFQFLERRVRKEVQGTQAKEANSSCSAEVVLSRLPSTSKVPKTNNNCLSPDQSSPEGNGRVKQPRQMPYNEPMNEFDDRNTWSEEYQQENQSQGRTEVPHLGTEDLVTSRACAKQEPIAQRAMVDPVSKLVRSYFLPGKLQKGSLSKASVFPTEGRNKNSVDGDLVLQTKVEALEAEILKFQTETKKVQRLVKEQEDNASQLYYEKASWEQRKNADMKKFQEYKDEQMRKVKKHHQTLEKLSQEILQLPTKKERNQIEDLRVALSEMKEEHLKKESRWRLTEKRLRGIIDELNGQSRELQEEIKRYEGRLHQEWQAKDSVSVSKCERGTSVDYNNLSISMREMSNYVSSEECTSDHQTTGVKMSCEAFEAKHENPYIFDSRIGMSASLKTREMTAMYQAYQSKGGRRMDTTTITELTEEGCTLLGTGTTFNKSSSHNCLLSNHELSGNNMENGTTIQEYEASRYLNIAERQLASRPETMQLESSGQSPSASRSKYMGLMKTVPQNGRNPETLAGRTMIASEEPWLQQCVDKQDQKGITAISSKGEVEDGQHDISNKVNTSSVALNNTEAEKHVSVDDCVYFANGDIKNTLPDGSIEYYYSEVDTWHTTKPNGVEIFYFPDYQVEEHWPNGQKKIISPDGSFYVIGGEHGSVPC